MKRKLHNTILRSITALAAATCVIGAMTLDSDSQAPAVLVVGGLVWLSLFYWAQER